MKKTILQETKPSNKFEPFFDIIKLSLYGVLNVFL